MEHAVEHAFFAGDASLIIRGETLDFDEIASRLNVEPAKCLKKGGKVSVSGKKVSKDFWMYTVKMRDNNPVSSLVQLLKDLEPGIAYIHQLSDSGYDVCLRIYYQSELGQIYFEMPNELQSLIAKFRVRLEFSILSWGGAV